MEELDSVDAEPPHHEADVGNLPLDGKSMMGKLARHSFIFSIYLRT